jgi:dUTP pyrophosphatase
MTYNHFEKVSYEQFKTDYLKLFWKEAEIPNDLEEYIHKIYDNIRIPETKTAGSAGCDISTPISFKLEPGETITFPLGIKAYFEKGNVLMIFPRSSTGMNGLYILNSVGIIDSDYSSAKNEGHIFAGLGNRSDETIRYGEGDRILQAVLVPHLTMGDASTVERIGGFGSTN